MGKRLVELRDAAVMGDPDAMCRLLEDLHIVIRRYLGRRWRGYTLVDTWADDICQDTLVRIWRGLPRCRARSDRELTAWAIAAAHSAVMEHCRSLLPLTAAVGGVPVDELPGTDDDPPSAGAIGRLLELLEGAHAQLPPGQQEVIYARVQLSMPWSDAGASTGVTPEGAKRRYQRAKARLRASILRRLDEDPELRAQVLAYLKGEA